MASAITTHSRSGIYPMSFTPKTNANEITILTPENKTYTQPMSGYYPATYGFENDLIGTIPKDWLDESVYSSCSISVYNQKDGHMNVVRIYDANTGTGADAVARYDFESPKVTGIVECWVYKESGSAALVIQGSDGSDGGFQMTIDAENNGVFRYAHAPSTYTEFADGKYADQEWFHLRIDFNCDTDTADYYLNGIKEVENGSFYIPVSQVSYLLIRSGHSGHSGVMYFDAVSFSWDGDYNIGDSLDEGLLLSYENNTNLDWQGYSYDGQANKTILGNTTIPMPSYGLHKIQVFGNDSFGTTYQTSIRYFTISPISILTPENKTYTQPMSGYYPATFGFENDLSSTPPQGLISTAGSGTSIEVIDQLDGHNKITRLYDGASGENNYANLSHTFSPQPTGVVEFWFRRSGVEEIIFIELWNETFNCLSIYSQDIGSGLAFEYYNGTDYVTIISQNSDQWYHHRLDFNCTSGTFDWYIDGVLRGDDLLLRDPTPYFVRFTVRTRGWGSTGYNAYIDGFGTSWDSNYNVGDNFNEGLLLSYDNSIALDWQAYSYDGQANKTILGNTTIPMPTSGLHTIQMFGNSSFGTMYQSPVRYFSISPINIITPENKTYTQPMNGYYPGTYGFENEGDSELGTEVAFITRYESDHSEAYARIEDNIYGRNNVLKFYDAATTNNYNFYAFHDFPNKIPYGTIEFWVLNTEYSGDRLGIYYHFSNSSGADYVSVDTFNSLFYLIIDGDNDGLVRIQTGSGETSWSGLYSDYTWHHIRIDFESTAGGYLGLGQYKLNFWFDGMQLLTNEPLIINDSLGVIASHSHGWDDTRHDYLDAVGFSWDPNYNIGDNLYEGLLLSYENRSNLDWIGYSLDGQSNKTILGQTTIPLLNNGLHSLVLTANDTSGTYFRSNLRYFTVLTSGPSVSATSPLPNQYFGVSAPSFNVGVQGVNVDNFWYSLDDGVTNITFSSYSGGISQSEWDKFPHGSVQIIFYVNDSFGRIGYDTIVIYKDINAPTTSLEYTQFNPPNEVSGSTNFTLTVADDGSGVSTSEYKINDGSWTTYTGAFTLSGFDPGTYTITYRSVDIVGNIESEQLLNVRLVIPPPEPPDLSFLLYIIIIGAVITTIGILYIKVIRPKTAESRELKKKNRLEQKRLKRERLENLTFERNILERERLEQMRSDRDVEIQMQSIPVAIESVDRRREKSLGIKYCPECGNPLKSEDMNFCYN